MFSIEPQAHRDPMGAVLKRYVELAEKAGHELHGEMIGPALEMFVQIQGGDD